MRRPPVFLALFGYFAFCAVALGALAYYWSNYQQAPVQPIQFPHTIHADKLGIDCTYCHAYADKAALPGIPAVALCMDCHKNAATDRPEIIKLTAYWNDRQPIRWIRVHQSLPTRPCRQQGNFSAFFHREALLHHPPSRP